METVIMPKKLTAESGAKALLMGEFSIPFPAECPECGGKDTHEDCRTCDGNGQIMIKINVPWVTIKEIYSKAVHHLSKPNNHQP